MKSKFNKILITATAATTCVAPISFMASCSCSSEVVFDLTIAGDASYDKANSKLELNKDSTIVLVPPTGQEINKVRKVKVGTNLLSENLYSFDKETRTLTIKASAMTNSNIYIETDTVSTEEIIAVAIKNKPTTLTYPQGYYFDLSGLEVVAITKTGQKVSTTNYTTTIADKTRLMDIGTKTVTVKLNDTQLTDSFDITVTQPIVEKIEITTQPTNRIYTASDKLDFTGLVLKATKSNSEIDTDFKGYTAVPAEGSSFSSLGYQDVTFSCDKGTVSTQIYVTSDPIKFSEATWENVSDWAYCLESGIATEQNLCEHFLTSSGAQFASLASFVGQERTVTVNGKSHTVRVIGVNHDEIAEDYQAVKAGTKATFTFQFFNQITDKSQTLGYQTYYDGYSHTDYTNSQVRYNLDKKGSAGGIMWNKGSGSQSVFEMLPSEFKNYVWLVNKKVGTKASGETEVTMTDYTDRLFIPTMTEYNQSGTIGSYTIIPNEGTAYEYWKTHTATSRKILAVDETSSQTSAPYHCPSLAINEGYNTGVFYVDSTDGSFNSNLYLTDSNYAIVPCFCI